LIGFPRLTSAAFDAHEMRQRAATCKAFALSVLDGSDPRSIPRLSGMAMKNPDIRRILETAARNYYAGSRESSRRGSKSTRALVHIVELV